MLSASAGADQVSCDYPPIADLWRGPRFRHGVVSDTAVADSGLPQLRTSGALDMLLD